MPCFFCNSVGHLSEYCNIYVSDAERKKVALTKNCCQFCLTENDKRVKPGHPPRGKSFICKNKKCYICFSKEHSTVFCPDRLNTAQTHFTFPEINDVLLPRFIKMFKCFEQLLLAMDLSPTTKHLFKPLKLVAEMKIEDLFRLAHLNVVVFRELYLLGHGFEKLWYQTSEDFNYLPLENITFEPKKVIINLSKMATPYFFQFIGPSTEELYCMDLELSSKITFEELLQRIPNIEHIYFRKTNIVIDNSWPQFLLDSNCEELEAIDFDVESINFDVGVLATLMKERKMRVNLYFDEKNENILGDRFSKYFNAVENETESKVSILKISSDNQTFAFEPKI